MKLKSIITIVLSAIVLFSLVWIIFGEINRNNQSRNVAGGKLEDSETITPQPPSQQTSKDIVKPETTAVDSSINESEKTSADKKDTDVAKKEEKSYVIAYYFYTSKR